MNVARALAFVVITAAVTHGAAADEWHSLFDGATLSGWRASENAATWRVEGGALVTSGPRSHLYYTGPVEGASFRNVEFEAEVMTEPGANSGVYVHTAYTDTGWPATGLEVQVNNTHRGEGGYIEHKKTGSLYGIRNVYGQLVKDREWFRLRIAVRGARVQVHVNDILTVDYVFPERAAGDTSAARRPSSGTFALQGHDPHSVVRYRNIRVRPLGADASEPPGPPADDLGRELVRLGGANYPVVDFHTHLKGTLTLADVLKRWRADGIYAGVAINGGLSFPINSDAGLEPALRELAGQPVFTAFQAEGREWVRLFSRKTLERFDYVFTDAMTWTDDSGRRMRLWIKDEVGAIPDAERFMDMLVARTIRILNDEPIDLHVNPTFLPEVIAADYDRLWTPARMDQVVAALKANGIGLEINNRYRIPSARFINAAKHAGVKFACGTNNAAAHDLGRMEYCQQMIRECGLTWQDMWMPPADGQKAVQRKPLQP